MPNISSLVFRHGPRAIAVFAWVAMSLSVLALLAFAVLSVVVTAGDPSPDVLELAPFRWRRHGAG